MVLTSKWGRIQQEIQIWHVQVTWRCVAVRELPKDVLKMASGLISPSGWPGHRRQLCSVTQWHFAGANICNTTPLPSCGEYLQAVSTHIRTGVTAHTTSLELQSYTCSFLKMLFKILAKKLYWRDKVWLGQWRRDNKLWMRNASGVCGLIAVLLYFGGRMFTWKTEIKRRTAAHS